MSNHKIPIGEAVAAMIEYVKAHGRSLFDGVSAVMRGSVDGLTAALRAVPSPILIVVIGVLAWILRRSVLLAIFVVAALIFIINQGYWQATLETLSLVLVAAFFSAAIGIPLGIMAAHSPRSYAAMRPILDLMQTLPTFVYLIPTLVLFGLGVVPGLISTVIFALAGTNPAHAPRYFIRAASIARSRQVLRRNPRPDAVENRVTERRADHPGGHHAMHHAESVHGRHRSPGGRRRPRRSRCEGAQHRAGGHGVRGRIRDCVVGHYSRSHQPPG